MKKLIFMILTVLSVLMVPMYVVADTYPSKTTTDKTVSQEKLQPENDTQKRETGQPEEKKQELDEIEKARQALQYGLESEILEVINKVDKRDFETLQGDFNRLFMETKSPAVREGLCSRRAQERACQAPLQGLWCVPCQGIRSGSPHERRMLRPGKVRRVDGNLTGPQEREDAWTTMPISQR